MSDVCAECCFFQSHGERGGVCRRYPPTIAGKWMPPGKDAPVDDCRFPWVKANYWCGEFQLEPAYMRPIGEAASRVAARLAKRFTD